MSDAVSSSPARGSSKVTYGGRGRKRRVRDATYKDNGPSESESEVEEEPAPRTTRSQDKMSTRTPKKVDVHLPGPSPKGTPKESASQPASAKKPESTRKRGLHSRTGSMASLAREDTLVAADSPTKPVSSTKTRSMLSRTDTQDDVDEGSVAGDSIRRSRKKNEAERKQFLEDDPHSGEVEPHRMYCKTCSTWVDLNPKLRYIMKLWVEHRKSCGSKDGSDSASKDEAADDDTASIVAPSLSETPGQNKRVTKEEDRKAVIESHPHADEVQPHQVFCSGCDQWIRLSTETRYSLYPWRLHLQRCTGTAPSKRVAVAQYKLQLVNDSQAKQFNTDYVVCKECHDKIELEADYDMTKWNEHKATCTPRVPGSTKKKAVAPNVRPPPSIASTEEDTVVGTERLTVTPQKSTKRAREDDGEDASERAVRQRDASYEPPQGEGPGFLSWITQPFRSFIKGFREGLAGEGESSSSSS